MKRPDIKTLNKLARTAAYKAARESGYYDHVDVIKCQHRADHYGMAIGSKRIVKRRKSNYDDILAAEIVKARRVVRAMNWDLI